jgi:hypothetical protein
VRLRWDPSSASLAFLANPPKRPGLAV